MADGDMVLCVEIDNEPILRDAIDFYMRHQSKKKTVVYLHTKYHITISHKSLTEIFKNTMLYGAYRDNPSYCEGYMDKETFDRLQKIQKRNVKENTAENRAYIFSGLIKCPYCGCALKGTTSYQKRGEYEYKYKRYRCGKNKVNGTCSFGKTISENVFEKMMLADIEKYMEEAKIRSAQVSDSDSVGVPKYDIEEIYEQIDRLNYSWQTGKIRKVEQYEKDYAELTELLEKAQAEQGEAEAKDFSKIETILHSGWETIYNALDDTYKRAFWRSFVKSIEIDWTTNKKEITRVNFF